MIRLNVAFTKTYSPGEWLISHLPPTFAIIIHIPRPCVWRLRVPYLMSSSPSSRVPKSQVPTHASRCPRPPSFLRMNIRKAKSFVITRYFKAVFILYRMAFASARKPITDRVSVHTKEQWFRRDFCKGWFPVSRKFYMSTRVTFTFANKIEAMHERLLVSVKVEPRSTSRFEAQHFLSCLYFIYVNKIYVR